MILRLRRTNLAPAYQDWVHYIVYEDDKDVGRIYEDRAAAPEQQWSWSLTVEVNPHGIVTSGKTGTFDDAKAAFRTTWATVSELRKGVRPP
jgi:hypothetical protein